MTIKKANAELSGTPTWRGGKAGLFGLRGPGGRSCRAVSMQAIRQPVMRAVKPAP